MEKTIREVLATTNHRLPADQTDDAAVRRMADAAKTCLGRRRPVGANGRLPSKVFSLQIAKAMIDAVYPNWAAMGMSPPENLMLFARAAADRIVAAADVTAHEAAQTVRAEEYRKTMTQTSATQE